VFQYDEECAWLPFYYWITRIIIYLYDKWCYVPLNFSRYYITKYVELSRITLWIYKNTGNKKNVFFIHSFLLKYRMNKRYKSTRTFLFFLLLFVEQRKKTIHKANRCDRNYFHYEQSFLYYHIYGKGQAKTLTLSHLKIVFYEKVFLGGNWN
jgi:hypothetical protein